MPMIGFRVVEPASGISLIVGPASVYIKRTARGATSRAFGRLRELPLAVLLAPGCRRGVSVQPGLWLRDLFRDVVDTLTSAAGRRARARRLRPDLPDRSDPCTNASPRAVQGNGWPRPCRDCAATPGPAGPVGLSPRDSPQNRPRNRPRKRLTPAYNARMDVPLLRDFDPPLPALPRGSDLSRGCPCPVSPSLACLPSLSPRPLLRRSS